MRPTFDLQSHSHCSDGELAPARVVAAAARAGVELLALSDHDSTDGVAEALAAGREHGVRVVPAVEISTLDRGTLDLHVLGYLVDHEDERLGERLAASRAQRVERAEAMAAALADLGFALDGSKIAARRAAGRAVGRPHLAAAVTGHPANAERLAEEGVAEASAFLVRYLIEGAPAFVPRSAPAVGDAIQWIHQAGGLAVWAHPGFDIESEGAVLATLHRMRAEGLDGVEAFYITHTRAQTELLHGHARRLGLLTTGSADFHGPHHARFHTFRAFDLHGLQPELGPIGGG